jgi:hypothetical protein
LIVRLPPQSCHSTILIPNDRYWPEADLCNLYSGKTGDSSYPQFTLAASIAESFSVSHHSDFLGRVRNGTDGGSWSILWHGCLKSGITPVHDVLYI